MKLSLCRVLSALQEQCCVTCISQGIIGHVPEAWPSSSQAQAQAGVARAYRYSTAAILYDVLTAVGFCYYPASVCDQPYAPSRRAPPEAGGVAGNGCSQHPLSEVVLQAQPAAHVRRCRDARAVIWTVIIVISLLCDIAAQREPRPAPAPTSLVQQPTPALASPAPVELHRAGGRVPL